MRQINPILAGIAAVMLAAGLSGCAGSEGEEKTGGQTVPAQADKGADTQATGHSHDSHSHGEDGHHDGDDDAETIKEALAELSDEDRAAAEKQKDCPVAGKALGSMGKPIKVSVKDTDVWICCGGCKKKLTDDPDTYLAKLKSE